MRAIAYYAVARKDSKSIGMQYILSISDMGLFLK